MRGKEIKHKFRPGRIRRTMMLAAALLGVLALAVAPGPASSAQDGRAGDKAAREYTVPANQPEGVVYDDRTQAFYGGSSLSGDGTVYKATLDGDAEVFMPTGFDGAGDPDPTRTQTHGFNVDKHDRLYVADVLSGFLHVYQLPEGNKVATFDTKEIPDDEGPAPYINDVAISPKTGDVYFTDSNRPYIYRVTREQVEAGGGVPQAIDIDPPVDYGKNTRTNNGLEANGIRFTPGGKYIIFDSLNNGELYRLTPLKGDPEDEPIVDGSDRIVTVEGPSPVELGNIDGLEFKDGNTLYAVDNSSTINETPGSFDDNPERVLNLRFSGDYRRAEIVKETTNPEFRTPTAASLAPGNRLLINNAEFFDTNGPPYVVLSIPRP